ncbi:MAG: AtpZ/AtpI family protein [Candidatus Moranbacteria bacterium]|nr:AtpZ/AtpI family protein [Candidatus Moranbacteria bacterium]
MAVENKAKVAWWQQGMELFLRLSGLIGGPIIVAILVGKWLDRKYASEPWLFLLCTAVAFLFSMGALIVIGAKEFKRIESENKNKKS